MSLPILQPASTCTGACPDCPNKDAKHGDGHAPAAEAHAHHLPAGYRDALEQPALEMSLHE